MLPAVPLVLTVKPMLLKEIRLFTLEDRYSAFVNRCPSCNSIVVYDFCHDCYASTEQFYLKVCFPSHPVIFSILLSLTFLFILFPPRHQIAVRKQAPSAFL